MANTTFRVLGDVQNAIRDRKITEKSKLHEHGKTSKEEQAGKSVVNMHQQRNERKYAHVSRSFVRAG